MLMAFTSVRDCLQSRHLLLLLTTIPLSLIIAKIILYSMRAALTHTPHSKMVDSTMTLQPQDAHSNASPTAASRKAELERLWRFDWSYSGIPTFAHLWLPPKSTDDLAWFSEQGRFNHGDVFALAWEEGLIASNSSVHVGLRTRLSGPRDLADDAMQGFLPIYADEIDDIGTRGIVERLNVVGADIVEVSPAYDGPGEQTHAQCHIRSASKIHDGFHDAAPECRCDDMRLERIPDGWCCVT
ncbi:hypothetical protein B0T17DRAFT_602488 [Bombardia bombarda]|uniref:Uncharacterized protein n=1 Tax=Bombardia bombarda TaxID=252184 RepID=A0AA39WBQ7_9PEZI|nr:hypothetical protein B0T17DRAFT_602488 [Bombardia bombarda]